MSRKTIEQIAAEFDAFEKSRQNLASLAISDSATELAPSVEVEFVEQPIAEPVPAVEPEVSPQPVAVPKPIDVHAAKTELLDPLTDEVLKDMDAKKAAAAAVENKNIPTVSKSGADDVPKQAEVKASCRSVLKYAGYGLLGLVGLAEVGSVTGVSLSNLAEGNGPINLMKGTNRGFIPESVPFSESIPTVARWHVDSVEDKVAKFTGDEKSQKEGN